MAEFGDIPGNRRRRQVDHLDASFDEEYRKFTLTEKRLLDVISKSHEIQDKKFEDLVNNKFEEIRELILSAFPNKDPRGHREAHERMIASSNKWRTLKYDLITKLMTGGGYISIGFIIYAVWEAFKLKIRE